MTPAILLITLITLLPGLALAAAAYQVTDIARTRTQLTASTVAVTPLDVPVAAAQPTPLELTAESVYAVDRASGAVLYKKNADQMRPIASITKLATIITIAKTRDRDEVVEIPKLPEYKPEDARIGLVAGERYLISDLLTATVVNSANDAADALAIIEGGSIGGFSAKMTDLMHEWGIADAKFASASGLKDEGNEASAKAVAQMGLLALHNKDLRELFGTQSTTISSEGGRVLTAITTNQLLQSGRFTGIKTGYTPTSGQCFIGLTTIQGHQVVTVVLGSKDRFSESVQLADWIDRNYKWQ